MAPVASPIVRAAPSSSPPRCFYRVQMQPSFGFRNLAAIVPYLESLGISGLYLSPILQPRRGSTHGYDVVDPGHLNPELGSPDDLVDVHRLLQKFGMGILQDIVPNHMAFASENHRLMDVLAYGEASPYHAFFDIDWHHPTESLRGRVLTPFLGQSFAECLEAGEIRLHYEQGDLQVRYYQLHLPVRLRSWATVFERDLPSLEAVLGRGHPTFIRFLGCIGLLRTLAGSPDIPRRIEPIDHAKRMLFDLYQHDLQVQTYMQHCVNTCNGTVGDPRSFDRLDALLSEQVYRLAFWKVAAEELNYRRFFNINDLICLRIEKEEVFLDTHSLLLELVAKGVITGLRIDHIDGLFDPEGYLRRLRQAAPDLYVVVEKILEKRERLPASWPINGDTGYAFLNQVNGLFVRRRHRPALTRLYRRFSGMRQSFGAMVAEKKRLIIGKHMAGNIDNLARMITDIAGHDRYGRDITLYGLRRALVEVMTFFPVYRSYVSHERYSPADDRYIRIAIKRARESSPGLIFELNYIERFLSLQLVEADGRSTEPGTQPAGGLRPEPLAAIGSPVGGRQRCIDLLMVFQQFTGPLMAKGFEDTVLYIHTLLTSLNEVGGNPRHFGMSPADFHARNRHRLATHPSALITTGTHDTKRGEDVRARLNVLSELPQEWGRHLRRWHHLNRAARTINNKRGMPDRNDEYLIYQTMLGTWPFDPMEHGRWRERLEQYIVKAVREAKVHTAWIKPDACYEDACVAFVRQTLTEPEASPFMQSFLPFARRIAWAGMANGLAQTLLKLTSPGIPDIYQGSELWDLRLVDPDNRGPVDFELRQRLLTTMVSQATSDRRKLLADLVANPEDGRIKLFVTWQALQVRRAHPEVFEVGRYVAVPIRGRRRGQAVAFARHHAGEWTITVIPRFFARRIPPGQWALGPELWGDTTLELPRECPTSWTDAFSGAEIHAPKRPGDHPHGPRLPLAQVFASFPLGLLVGKA
jgi:(1->4)-alpha-D-glucan 1-alpha-D-glucosylmutase